MAVPPTDDQIRYLQHLGYAGLLPETREEASAAIDAFLKAGNQDEAEHAILNIRSQDPAWIDEYLASNFDDIYARFLLYAKSRLPRRWYSEIDDLFQEWCIQQLKHWRQKDRPPKPNDKAEVGRFFWKAPWIRSYPRWTAGAVIRRLLHLPPKNFVAVEAIDPDLHCQQPAREIEDFAVDGNPLETLTPAFTPEDINVLLACRNSQSPAMSSQRLEISKDSLDGQLHALRKKVEGFGRRVRDAIRSIVYGKVIFLSSTYLDLKDYRRAIIEKIHKLAANGVPLVVVSMEYLMTGSDHPGRRCLELVGRADVYVGLFAKRYGSVWDKMEISFTEAELREAERQKLERCIYFPTEQCLAMLPDDTSSDKVARIAELKNELQNAYIVEHFDSPQGLAALVADRLSSSFWK